jgi:general secretion pathway protein A
MPGEGTPGGLLGLGALLDGAAAAADLPSAFRSLYARWGVTFQGEGGALGCEQARGHGLRCLLRSGDWSRLRSLDLPAIIELVTPAGQRRYATVAALSDDRVTLDLGDRETTLATSEVDPYWSGPFIVLWRPPSVGTLPLAPGLRGADVEFLRQRLARVDGQPVTWQTRTLYDEELRRRVVAFQRSRSLLPDGMVGEETLAHLVTATAGSTRPRLTARALP